MPKRTRSAFWVRFASNMIRFQKILQSLSTGTAGSSHHMQRCTCSVTGMNIPGLPQVPSWACSRWAHSRLGLPSVMTCGSRTCSDSMQNSGSVASITGIEWAFPEGGNRLDTLSALSFQRETLASLPVRQIWWVPSSLTERFVLGVPDLDSWFRLRLHLTEVPPLPADAGRKIAGPDERAVSVDEARSLARRFSERLDAARAQNIPEDRIFTELAQPAVDALLSTGLGREAETILARTPEARAGTWDTGPCRYAGSG